VGKSYTGAMPQLCNYALGVLDKAPGTLKVVPIDGDKVYASSR
jgi:DNA-directed RNA polymerase I subunit RPA49